MADADGNEKGCCEKFSDGINDFLHFLYNKESGLVLGRTGKSWAKIGFFYLIFYGFLAGFFSGMLAVFLTTLNDPEEGLGPKLTQFVENQPGLTLVGGLNLQYNKSDESAIKAYVDAISKHMKKFDKSPKCNVTENEDGMPKDKDCYFKTSLLGDCQVGKLAERMKEGKPCVYVRMNKVYGWVPKSSGPDDTGYLKLKCDPENPEVEFFPKGGFQISAFPFRGQKDYEPPVVAVKFNRTKYPVLKCYLEGKGIKLSESYVPYRAYGRIQID